MVRNPTAPTSIGNRLAPPRFILFAIVVLLAVPASILVTDWSLGAMIGFDAASIVFIASTIPLFRDDDPGRMRIAAERNDANRGLLLVITAMVMLVILTSIAAVLGARDQHEPIIIILIIGTLTLTWVFSNLVFTLHYAHIYYTRAPNGADSKGLSFPGRDDPDYWDFTYFSFTLGMTFQTSDVEIGTRPFRRIATFHSLAAFVFNIGVLAFSINALGGG